MLEENCRKIQFEGHRKRLRERFVKSGLEAFHDYEVLELLLTYAIPRRDVKPVAKRLLAHFKSLASVFDAPRESLEKIEGVGLQAAILISLIPQLFERYTFDRQKYKKVLSSARETWEYMRPKVDKSFESLWIIALNSQNQVLAVEMIHKGTVNKTMVIPRLIVESAIKHKATSIILVHNHPSGNAFPSKADYQITSLLKHLLETLDIRLLDHIIITGSSYYSFSETGELS
ncbi:MAG: DNA repair protein RadC [Syntrophobacterales bacterium]|nr:DNA repair protein RadC [Syntrophobacterales bacterium]